MTLNELKAQEGVIPGMKKSEFQMQEPMEKRLEKIAHNSANPGEAKWKRSFEHMK